MNEITPNLVRRQLIDIAMRANDSNERCVFAELAGADFSLAGTNWEAYVDPAVASMWYELTLCEKLIAFVGAHHSANADIQRDFEGFRRGKS